MSIETQTTRCTAYCTAHGYQVLSVHSDEELSGGRADNRSALQAVIDAACQHKAILVVYKLDRLARNAEDALAIDRKLRKAKAGLASVNEEINTRSPMGKFFFTLLAAFAEMEREQIRQRASDAMRHHQASGRRMTTAERCPYGKQPDPANPDRLVDCPEEQAIIERIQQPWLEGEGLRAIARSLDQAENTCRGHHWSHSTIRSILSRVGLLAA
jgi:site-specific DNA recombinase